MMAQDQIELERMIQDLQDQVLALRQATTGWEGYALKDQEYIDDIQEYFDQVKQC